MIYILFIFSQTRLHFSRSLTTSRPDTSRFTINPTITHHAQSSAGLHIAIETHSHIALSHIPSVTPGKKPNKTFTILIRHPLSFHEQRLLQATSSLSRSPARKSNNSRPGTGISPCADVHLGCTYSYSRPFTKSFASILSSIFQLYLFAAKFYRYLAHHRSHLSGFVSNRYLSV